MAYFVMLQNGIGLVNLEQVALLMKPKGKEGGVYQAFDAKGQLLGEVPAAEVQAALHLQEDRLRFRGL